MGANSHVGANRGEKALPFDSLVPNAETIAAMKKTRRGGLASFATVDGLIADLIDGHGVK
jgi:antitoxin component of RelBE/YafQ-DinJ toxin-antitoxin module